MALTGEGGSGSERNAKASEGYPDHRSLRRSRVHVTSVKPVNPKENQSSIRR